MSIPSVVRKAVKKVHPDLVFKIRKESFTSLGYGESYFLESDAWGICIGNQDLYQSVIKIIKTTGCKCIVMW